MSSRGVQLSVVVATYNRRAELATMLGSLLPQIEGLPVEVLIVDDRSTDGTWEWLEDAFGRQPNIALLRTDLNSGPGPARNVALEVASGHSFVPMDSDFIVTDGAIKKILATVHNEPHYSLIFFPCLEYPAMRRLDELSGDREIRSEDLTGGRCGELIPVVNLAYMRERGLRYPALRSGGESLLWATIVDDGPALFVDRPLVLYRTDVLNRICTLDYQLAHPEDLAAIAEASIESLRRRPERNGNGLLAQKYLAAGTYHVLAGNILTGWQRLYAAATAGSSLALLTLIMSLAGRPAFRFFFRMYRTRVRRAYLR